MKKVFISAILVLFLGSLFALESGPSDVVGFVKYDVFLNDFTMIAIPFPTTLAMASDLAADISPDVTDVIFWNNAWFGWQQYSTASPATDYAITSDMSYLVYKGGTANVDWYSYGDLPTAATFDIFANDFTQIMLPLDRSDLVMASDLANDIGPGVTDVITWNNAWFGWQQYSTASPATDFAIDIGQGFLIYSTAAYPGWNSPDDNITRTVEVPVERENNSKIRKSLEISE
jgi:hypothetical protein